MIHTQDKLYLAKKYSIIPTRRGYAFYSPVGNKIVELNAQGCALLLLFKDGNTIQNILGTVSDTNKEKITHFVRQQIDNELLFTNPLDASKVSFAAREKSFRPQKVYLHLTWQCNQRCVYCYNHDHRNRLREDLGTGEILDIVRQVKDLGGTEISFTGGEPLLRSDLEEILPYTKSLGLKSYLITNGGVNDDLTVDIISKYVNFINVSLDSSIKEEHEANRGLGTFEPAVAFIRKLVQRGRKDTYVRAVITKNNIKNIMKYPGFVKQLGCSLAPISVYLPNSMEEIEEKGLLPDLDEYWDVVRNYDRHLNEKFGKTNFMDEYFENNANCGMGNGILSIDSNGDVYPCQSLHFEELKAGNIKERSLEEIGNYSEALRAIRSWRINQVLDCADCTYVKLCGGGCRAIAYNLTRNFNGYNQLFCSYFRKLSEFWMNRMLNGHHVMRSMNHICT